MMKCEPIRHLDSLNKASFVEMANNGFKINYPVKVYTDKYMQEAFHREMAKHVIEVNLTCKCIFSVV